MAEWLLSSQDIIAISAVVISVMSFIVSVLTLRIQHVHNKKSVKPIGQITIGDYEEEIYVRIDNNGVGPLIISKFEARYLSVVKSNLIDVLPDDLNQKIVWISFVQEIEKKVIPSGERMILLKAKHGGDKDTSKITVHDQSWSELRKALAEVTIKLHYTDIYDSKIEERTRNLAFFNRHFVESINDI